jgi:cell wall assembly regulator SMI1
MAELRKFADRFNKSANAAKSTQTDIDKLEKELNIQLPNDYKRFCSASETFGRLIFWTLLVCNT